MQNIFHKYPEKKFEIIKVLFFFSQICRRENEMLNIKVGFFYSNKKTEVLSENYLLKNFDY